MSNDKIPANALALATAIQFTSDKMAAVPMAATAVCATVLMALIPAAFTITGADEEYEQDAPRLERKQEAMEKQAKMEEKAAQKALDKQAQIALSDSMLTAD